MFKFVLLGLLSTFSLLMYSYLGSAVSYEVCCIFYLCFDDTKCHIYYFFSFFFILGGVFSPLHLWHEMVLIAGGHAKTIAVLLGIFTKADYVQRSRTFHMQFGRIQRGNGTVMKFYHRLWIWCYLYISDHEYGCFGGVAFKAIIIHVQGWSLTFSALN